MSDHYTFQSPIGWLKLRADRGYITGLSVQQGCRETEALQKFAQHSDLLYEAYKQLQEYFEGKRTQFELPINNAGTIFQKSVWQELRQIPYGETRSYEEIAVALGNPGACRAVGQKIKNFCWIWNRGNVSVGELLHDKNQINRSYYHVLEKTQAKNHSQNNRPMGKDGTKRCTGHSDRGKKWSGNFKRRIGLYQRDQSFDLNI